MRKNSRVLLAGLSTLLLLSLATASSKRQEFRFKVAPGATVTVVNRFGPISIQAGNGAEVVVTALVHSSKVEVLTTHNGNRVEVRSHVLQPGTDDEATVDYQVLAPPDVNVTLRSANGMLTAERLRGNLLIQAESAPVQLRDLRNAHVQVHTAGGPIGLTRVADTYVDLVSIAGGITLDNVTGPKLSASSNSGEIRYAGDFAGDGEYSLMTHSGNINVALPANSSIVLTARSISGSVHADFPFQPISHPAFPPDSRSFAGQAQAGGSSVRLNSFSGVITVTKQ